MPGPNVKFLPYVKGKQLFNSIYSDLLLSFQIY
jgi:hypothetical protein